MNLDQKIKIIRSSPFFNSLDEKEAQIIAQNTKEKLIAPKTVFISQGEQPDVAYLILSGAVRIFRITEEGSEINLAILGPGEIVGEMSLLDQQERSATVETLKETQVLVLDRYAFSKILQNHPQTAIKLLQTFARRVRSADEHVEEILSKDLRERVLKALEILANYFPKKDITLTHEELAAIVGATRPRVTEILDDLAKEAKISLSHRKIHIF